MPGPLSTKRRSEISPDRTQREIETYLADPRIHSIRFESNQGMGAAINAGLERANVRFIAYLPSDDVYYADHPPSLIACLEENPQAIAAFSGVRHHYNRTAEGQIDGYPLQLV